MPMFSLKGEALDDQRAALGHHSPPETRLFPGTAQPRCQSVHMRRKLCVNTGDTAPGQKKNVSRGRATSTLAELHNHHLEKFITFPFLGNVDSKGKVPLRNT